MTALAKFLQTRPRAGEAWLDVELMLLIEVRDDDGLFRQNGQRCQRGVVGRIGSVDGGAQRKFALSRKEFRSRARIGRYQLKD